MVNAKDIGDVKHFSEDDLRFATPLNVSKRRAEDLKCKIIVDLCSGIGIQAGAFAKTCKQVYGFELDPRKVEYAKKNFEGLKNLTFECGDVLSKEVIEKVKKIGPDIIFCDPERLPQEKERNLDSIQPNLKKLVESYSKICKNLCIEVPPRIDLDKLNVLGNFEAEYLSLDNKLNRLDLKFGDLKKDERSVVDVFSGSCVVNNKDKKADHTHKIFNYIYEVSESIVKANLINELASLLCVNILDNSEKNKVLFTSKDSQTEFGCFVKLYIVIGTVERPNKINNFLRNKGFGKVVIKYSIDPKEYWNERNYIENRLKGDREGVVFKIGREYVICEELD